MTTPVVDAHLHVWRRRPGRYAWLHGADAALQRDVTVDDAAEVVGAAGVRHVILVQAEDSLADTEDMLAVAEQAPWVAGIVGWIDLDGTRAQDQLDRWTRAPLVRGIRHLVHDDPRDDFLDLPAVRRSLHAVAAHDLVFEVPDAWPRHLAAAGRVARAVPELTVVIDHLAKPPDDDSYPLWHRALREVAASPNTVAKVSGLYGRHGPMPPELLRRVWDDALQAFGPDRLMWGSDWPMSIPYGGYRVAWQAVCPLVDGLSPDERDDMLGATARRVYRLGAEASDPPPTRREETPC